MCQWTLVVLFHRQCKDGRHDSSQNESPIILIGPWWLAAILLINPTSSILAVGTRRKLKCQSVAYIFLSFQLVLLTLMYVQLFKFLTSLVLISYLMIYKQGETLWLTSKTECDWSSVCIGGTETPRLNSMITTEKTHKKTQTNEIVYVMYM